MSTYLEIVIQERTTNGQRILTHRHFLIEHPGPGALAETLARDLAHYASSRQWEHRVSDPLRPCVLCRHITQEEQRDAPTSRHTPTR